MISNMKKVYYILLALAIVACKNGRQASAISEEQAKNDSIAMAMEADSIEREQIFEARGDTIFADLLYGMSKEEAQARIKKFQDNLKRHHLYPQSGFTFAGIDFMGIDIYDFTPSDSYDRYDKSYLLDGKLSSVIWHSSTQWAYSKGGVEHDLNEFISFFEKKFGKPSFKNTDPSYWIIIVDGEQRFIKREVAIWETNKRKVVITIKGEKCPLYDKSDSYSSHKREFGDYQYSIEVSFYDKKAFAEMEAINHAYVEEKGRKERERELQDSLKSINSL